MRNAHKILFKKLEGKKRFGRPGQRWEDIILIPVDVKVLRLEDMDLIH
jgi:hypothetical protein